MVTPETTLRATLLFGIITLVSSNNPSYSSQWDGECHNRCDEDPQLFCQLDTCFSCSDVCFENRYEETCHSRCQAYLNLPTIGNIWDGCSGHCQYDIMYFCEQVSSTCMECEGLCNVLTTYYKREKCIKNCEGYINSKPSTTLSKPFNEPTGSSTKQTLSTASTQQTVRPSSPNSIIAADKKMSRSITVVIVIVSVVLGVVMIMAVLKLLTYIIIVIRRRRRRRRQQGYPVEANSGAETANMVIMQQPLEFPIEEVNRGSESTALHEDGGRFPAVRFNRVG